jgi:hypothetical protein
VRHRRAHTAGPSNLCYSSSSDGSSKGSQTVAKQQQRVWVVAGSRVSKYQQQEPLPSRALQLLLLLLTAEQHQLQLQSSGPTQQWLAAMLQPGLRGRQALPAGQLLLLLLVLLQGQPLARLWVQLHWAASA